MFQNLLVPQQEGICFFDLLSLIVRFRHKFSVFTVRSRKLSAVFMPPLDKT